MIEHEGLPMDPQTITILVWVGLIYGAGTVVMMLLILRSSGRILEAAIRTADATEAMNAKG